MHFHRFIPAVLIASIAGLSAAGPAGADPRDSDNPTRRAPKAPAGPSSTPGPKLDDPKDVFGPAGGAARPSGGDAPAAAGSAGGWTVVLVMLRGEEQDALARLALNKVRTEGSLPGAFVEKRNESTIIAHGRFPAGDSPEAVAELKRVQEMVIAGERPYRHALLAPPMNIPAAGTLPQYNLAQARALYGDSAVYTLQIAVYGRDDLPRPTEKDLTEARRAAEAAALRLRQDGELAFYHHGQRLSMVTVGVFDETDFDPQVPSFQSTRLSDARRRHPQNLYNGAGIREKRKGEAKGRLQASTLVAVPRE